MTTTDDDWARLLAAASNPTDADATAPSATAVMALASNLGSTIDPESVGCSITMVNGDGFVTPAASSQQALGLDKAQYDYNEGPCVAAARSGDWYDIELMRDDRRWPHFVATALDHGVRSSLSVPLAIPLAPAALNLYSAGERAFANAHKRAVVDFLSRCLSSALTRADRLPTAAEPEPAALRESRAQGEVVSRAVAAIRAQRGASQSAAWPPSSRSRRTSWACSRPTTTSTT